MFTQPTVNQIASTYKGNPAPLNAKVEADKKQNGGIPQDLRQLMAAYDLSQGGKNMGIQQALQIPTNMPTVAQDVQERARQALQARMVQQAQQQQQKAGSPNVVPPGTPRPPMQAQGIDNLPTNVGEGYANGGIIGFSQPTEENNNSLVDDPDKKGLMRLPGEDFSAYRRRIFDTELQAQRDRNVAEEKARELERQRLLAERGANNMVPPSPFFERAPLALNATQRSAASIPSPTDPNFRRQPDPRITGTPAVSPSVPLITSGNRPPSANVNAADTKDKAPMPGGLTDLANLPSIGVGRDFLQRTLADNQKFDEEAFKQKYLKEVGAKDTSIYDEMATELKARKERLNAPKKGFDGLMEYLEGIVQSGGGRNWAETGAKGAAKVSALQKERQSQQDALMEKILDIGAKKKEAQYSERLGMFNLTKTEKDKINKESAELAKSLNMSETEAEKMRQQAIENELNRKNQIRAASIGAQDRDNLMSRARALMAANPKLTLEQAMQRAGEIGNAGQMESADVRRLSAFNTAKDKIDSKPQYISMLLDKKNDPKYAQLRQQYAAEIRQARIDAGLSAAGLNALPGASSSGTVPPPPPGYREK